VQTIAFITLPSAYLKMVMPTFEVLFMTSLERVPVSYFSILWNSERVFFELLWRKLEDIIRIKVKNKPNDDDYGECYEARTVVD